MAAPALFLIFLLVASGGTAAGDDRATLTHLPLRGTTDSGREHASDAPPQELMDYLNSTHGCGRFAALVTRTANAGEIFREHVFGGLTVFCPDDLAVAAFEPKFSNLSTDDQLAVLLHHGAAARYGREQIAAFEWMAVRTLATDAATNKSLFLTVGDDGDTVWLWPSPSSSGSGGAARLTKAISSDDSPLAVYVVDAVLLPSRLRQLLDGGDEEASPEVSSRGFMDQLMSMNGCGRFAGLVNATANATRIFECSSLVHGGLVVFCPDDKAVAAFEPAFKDLCADGQLAVLRYHAVAPASFRVSRTNGGFPVSTLASDLTRGYGLTIDHRGDTMELRTSSGGVARVTRMVTGEEEETLAVYLIDSVLLSRESMDEGLLQQYWSDVLNQFIVRILIFLSAVVGFVAVFFVVIYFVGLLSRRAP